MPEPLVIPANRTAPPPRNLATGGLHRGVGGHHGAGDALESGGREAGGQARDGVQDEACVQFDADDAGGCGQHFLRAHAQGLRESARSFERGAHAGARGAVGVTGVDENRAGAASRFFEMPTGKLNRRGHNRVGGKHGRGGGGAVGNNQTQVVARILANAGVQRRVAVSKRESHFSKRRASAPRISFAAIRWPWVKAAAGMRLRPSS